MVKLYINDILIENPPKIDIIETQLQFAQNANQESTSIQMEIPNMSNKEVKNVYMNNKGVITKTSCWRMIYLLCHYSSYVILNDKLTEEQLDSYMKYMTEDSIMAHKSIILKSIGCPHPIIYNYQQGYPELHYAKVCIPKKYYPIIPYIDMYCPTYEQYIPVPEYDEIINGRLNMTSHPFGYNKSMTVITKFDKDSIKPNIYIDCDVSMNIESWPNPKLFSTWTIGLHCKSMDKLFQNCPYEPHIYKWNVSYINQINYLFENAKVRDLSMLSFDNCKDGFYSFANSTITHSPRFERIKELIRMFENCYYLTDISLINPQNIKCLLHAFSGCYNLKSAFNNCGSVKINTIEGVFSGCCNLESAFNNTTFICSMRPSDAFENCISLRDVFNNCGDINFKYWHTIFINCIALKKINNTRLVSNSSSLLWKNCPNFKSYDVLCRY